MSQISDMDTKEKLIIAAIEILAKDPSSKMDAISEKAHVSRRTLHRYFVSREAMITEAAEYISDNILIDTEEAGKYGESPAIRLRKMFDDDLNKGSQFEFCHKFPKYFTNDKVGPKFRQMRTLFFGVLNQLKNDRFISPEVPNEWLSYAWMGIITSTNKAMEEDAIAPAKASDMAWSMFTNGVFSKS